MNKKRLGFILLAVLLLISLLGIVFLQPITQQESYHQFCDSETILGIPNFWNVISNIPFLVVGIWGLFNTGKLKGKRIQYQMFFMGITLVAIGSGYYHLNPNSQTLVWDRLPMTIAFMSLFSIVISEFVNAKMGRRLLFPLLLIGLFSVAFWMVFGDLKVYAVVQFYPLLAMLVILLLFSSKQNSVKGYWMLVIAYVLAKLFEHYDFQIQHVIHFWSGHTLKHLVIAVGIIGLGKSFFWESSFIPVKK